jgi:hypothetical protein
LFNSDQEISRLRDNLGIEYAGIYPQATAFDTGRMSALGSMDMFAMDLMVKPSPDIRKRTDQYIEALDLEDDRFFEPAPFNTRWNLLLRT